MAVCEVCGNDYDLTFGVHAAGSVHVFDSFECAIHAMARSARTAAVGSSGTGCRATVSSTAAPTAPAKPVRTRWSPTVRESTPLDHRAR